ncbi:MAG TPA: F0F1 ATP synthase subunit delta [Terriglobales bacterium]|nr:F0F1 ATP synthase subunit delta [Terriglobales bacterium]
MAINWSTFAIELLNFLILVWILQRLLYRPVLQAIERRKQADAAVREAARTLHAEAEELQRTYAARLAEWETEKIRLRGEFEAELDHARTQAWEQLERDLECGKTSHAAQEIQARGAEAARLEAEAVRSGAQFTAKLLRRVASPELQDRLIGMLLEDLARLPPPQGDALRHAPATVVELASAYPLHGAQEAALSGGLASLGAAPAALHCTVDATLLAGVRIQAGSHTLSANLADELAAFCQAGEGSA